ncbi:MAG: hypothetical protein R2773_06320 [Flavobacteriaceae bacterium]
MWTYRRFIQMHGSGLGMKPANKDDIDPFEEIMDHLKESEAFPLDTEFNVQDLKDLVYDFKGCRKNAQARTSLPTYGNSFGVPSLAVFNSWNGDRAGIIEPCMDTLPIKGGTAVNGQAMVFGNMGEKFHTGRLYP